MKKPMLVAATAALMGVALYLGHDTMTSPADAVSDLQLANAEALADDSEALQPPCNNTSGYKKWYMSPIVHEPMEKFRDCCFEEQTGYRPVACVDGL